MTVTQLHDIFLKSTGVCTDTRSVKKGSIFFALKGENFNGNKYALNALDSGSLFAVVDEKVEGDSRFILVRDVLCTLQDLANYHRKQLQCPVLAIVGSNGKTTTKELLAQVLRKKYDVCATRGNLNNHIGVPLTILSAKLETEFLLIEMGANHQKEIDSLCCIAEPDYGLIVNIGLAHLEGFGGVEGVKKGKTELYRYLNKECKLIFFNNDEASIKEFNEGLKKVQHYGAGTNVQVLNTTSNQDLLYLKVEIDKNSYAVRSQLFGGYNINNILTALAVGRYFEVDTLQMVLAIEEYLPDNNRSQVKITDKENYVVLDAYNANPTSMLNAIKEFSGLYDSNTYYILGDMLELGDASSYEHLKILTMLDSLDGDKYLVGGEFAKHKPVYDDNLNFRFYENVNSLMVDLNDLNICKSNILIKGSRGVALEKSLREL